MTAPLPAPSVLADGRTLARRHLVQILQRRASVVSLLVTPLVFACLFFGVFGRFMGGGQGGYGQYMLPGVIIQASLFNGMSSAMAAAEDTGSGMVRRLRSMPIARSAPLLGWLFARVVVALASLALLVLVGHLLGFRFHGGVLATICFVLVVVLICLTICAGYLALGLAAPNLPLLEALANIIFFPLLLLSNAYTPTSSYGTWLRPVVEQMPVSRAADLLRGLAAPEAPAVSTVLIGLGWLAGLFALFVFLGARRFGRPE